MLLFAFVINLSLYIFTQKRNHYYVSVYFVKTYFQLSVGISQASACIDQIIKYDSVSDTDLSLANFEIY
jgi:hypothetical protein